MLTEILLIVSINNELNILPNYSVLKLESDAHIQHAKRASPNTKRTEHSALLLHYKRRSALDNYPIRFTQLTSVLTTTIHIYMQQN